MDESDSKIILNVSFGEVFAKQFINFLTEDQLKIFNFATHLRSKGFSDLPGRNKSSTDVNKNDYNFLQKIKFARDNNLYHYHIGIPDYDKSKPLGNWTSKYILHYSYINNDVKIIDMSQHPPFSFPAVDYLK